MMGLKPNEPTIYSYILTLLMEQNQVLLMEQNHIHPNLFLISMRDQLFQHTLVHITQIMNYVIHVFLSLVVDYFTF